MEIEEIRNIEEKSRNINLKFNIKWGLILQIVGMFLSYLIVPITLNYLNNEKYGIWATILSILSWVTFIFNTNINNDVEIKNAVLISFIIMVVNFIFTISNQLYFAAQKSFLTGIPKITTLTKRKVRLTIAI